MTAKTLRVLIAEDHAVVREGTRDILERDPEIAVVGEAEDGFQAVRLASELQPDVLVLDLHLPGIGGIEVARRLKTISPQTKILVLSAYDDDDYVFAAMDAGAAGYLLKTAHGSEVTSAIHTVARGEIILQSSIAGKFLAAHGRGRDNVSAVEPLTEREIEILRLAAQGLRNKEIAQELRLSRRTVEGHLGNIFAKLGVSSRTEAVIHGASHGWFPLGPEVQAHDYR